MGLALEHEGVIIAGKGVTLNEKESQSIFEGN